MKEVLTTAVKAVNGGVFVVLFAVIGEAAVPKRFAGVFSAAPSIALANLIVIVVAKGHDEAQHQSMGMVFGAVAMTAACLAGVVLVRRYRAIRGSLGLCAVWLALAPAGYVAVTLLR